LEFGLSIFDGVQQGRGIASCIWRAMVCTPDGRASASTTLKFTQGVLRDHLDYVDFAGNLLHPPFPEAFGHEANSVPKGLRIA
jgi:hypothetical protein